MFMADRQPLPVIVDTSYSPHARLRPVPLTAVALTDDFWAPRRAINRAVTIPSQYQLCEETGRIDNFSRAAGAIDGPFQGIYFNDSDVYKWLEAAAWALAEAPDPAIEQLVESTIAAIAAAQRTDGYLNTFFALERADERWTNHDLHEMYCAGHLFQAAVAHYRATGKTSLLDVARRFADHICDTFGPEEQGKRFGADGHPEIELALVELFRATGERRYLDQAEYFVDARGYGRLGKPYGHRRPEYHQDHQPLREMDTLVGHAVRALYLNAGAADLHAETGEAALRTALERMWQAMTSRLMYVSGGLGARYEGEAFGVDYELPNTRAYTETCAAIGSVMWSWRMLMLDGDARYADLIEHTLYNAVLPGLSLTGDLYFYQNPLADAGGHRREPWFGTACCPPNVARTLAALPGYFYSVSDRGIWLHLYGANTARIALADGQLVELAQQTGYPWDGEIAIEVRGAGEFSLYLRIPAWCESGAALSVNDQLQSVTLAPGSYAELRRVWAPGDRVRLQLPMPVRQVECHPYVAENAGRVALTRGPLLYCVEAVDHPGIDLRDLALPDGAALAPVERPDALGGVVALEGDAELAAPPEAWHGRLYRTAGSVEAQGKRRSVPMRAVPYYAWANREPGQMLVWLRRL
jgi:uncharacterized protein